MPIALFPVSPASFSLFHTNIGKLRGVGDKAIVMSVCTCNPTSYTLHDCVTVERKMICITKRELSDCVVFNPIYVELHLVIIDSIRECFESDVVYI